MEKFSIEIETSAGWVNYHSILRPGQEKAREVCAELKNKFPTSHFRIVKWNGEVAS